MEETHIKVPGSGPGTFAMSPSSDSDYHGRSSMEYDEDDAHESGSHYDDGEEGSFRSISRTSSFHSAADERSLLDMDAKYRALQSKLSSSATSPSHRAEMQKPPPPPLNLEEGFDHRGGHSGPPPGGITRRSSTNYGQSVQELFRRAKLAGGVPGQQFADQTSVGSFTSSQEEEDPDVALELRSMYQKVQLCLEKRHQYQRRSLQREIDNPKNDSDWEIYPPPPKPAWKESKEFEDPGCEESSDFGSRKRHVPREVGEDFDFDKCKIPGPDPNRVFEIDDFGVYQVYDNAEAQRRGSPIVHVPTIREYYMDLNEIIAISSEGPAKSFAFRRLEYLEAKWNLYTLLNEYHEIADSKRNPHRDFYNVRKVDTHIHHSACMNQKHLLRFIKYKMKKSPDEVVIYRDNKQLTLSEVFESLNLSAYDLSIDTLDMHAHKDTFHRFDKFNLKYNPIGESRLREIFLKTDNYINGRYLAEITREVVEDLEQSKYQMAEYRISIYGRKLDEWDKLAAWVIDHKILSPNVRWLIQVPRLYDIYKSSGNVERFEDIVKNIFQPLYEVTKDPSSHPKLHVFLQRVVGFDSVDDESKPDRQFQRKFPTPKYWDSPNNPPYSYYLYYLYANVTALNHWRKLRGFNTLVLRPHCGEAGDPEHLVAAFLTSQGISHGILLRKVPFIQYLYYLDQIGIAMSPLSNNALFLTYDKNPFYSYFKRGMNVSLSSDDPLQFSYTREPLIEEFSVAAQIYKMSNVDMCELARNSVLQSGYEAEMKKHWLGKNYMLPGPAGNSMDKTNVPDVRLSYRHETYLHEIGLVEKYSGPGKLSRQLRLAKDFSDLNIKEEPHEK
uniref:AMP deaminase n=1 Tax=Blastobotrys adeninivorans TaxID=409370 RepID=A0A060TH66_BLAAD